MSKSPAQILADRIERDNQASGYYQLAPRDFRLIVRCLRDQSSEGERADRLQIALLAMTEYARGAVRILMDESPNGLVPKNLDHLLDRAKKAAELAYHPELLDGPALTGKDGSAAS